MRTKNQNIVLEILRTETQGTEIPALRAKQYPNDARDVSACLAIT